MDFAHVRVHAVPVGGMLSAFEPTENRDAPGAILPDGSLTRSTYGWNKR